MTKKQKEELAIGASGLGGAYAVNKFTSGLIGREKLYHGTGSEADYHNIKKNGFKAAGNTGRAGGMTDMAANAGMYTPENSKEFRSSAAKYSYGSPNKSTARMYSNYADLKPKHDTIYANQKAEILADPTPRSKAAVEDELVDLRKTLHGNRLKQATIEGMNPYGGKKNRIIEFSDPAHKPRRVPNPEIELAYKNVEPTWANRVNKSALNRNMGAFKDIDPVYIKGNKGYNKQILKDLPGYIKGKPRRFAIGLTGVVGGTALIGHAAREAYKKIKDR